MPIQYNQSIDMNDHKITELSDPTTAQDAANKRWTEGLFHVSSGGNTPNGDMRALADDPTQPLGFSYQILSGAPDPPVLSNDFVFAGVASYKAVVGAGQSIKILSPIGPAYSPQGYSSLGTPEQVWRFTYKAIGTGGAAVGTIQANIVFVEPSGTTTPVEILAAGAPVDNDEKTLNGVQPVTSLGTGAYLEWTLVGDAARVTTYYIGAVNTSRVITGVDIGKIDIENFPIQMIGEDGKVKIRFSHQQGVSTKYQWIDPNEVVIAEIRLDNDGFGNYAWVFEKLAGDQDIVMASNKAFSVTTNETISLENGDASIFLNTGGGITVNPGDSSKSVSMETHKITNVVDPISAQDAATKTYADLKLAKASNLSDLASASTARTNLGLGTAAVVDVPASGDAASGEAVKGNDTRLTNARTPSAHKTSHETGGSDAITALAASVITSGTLAVARGGTNASTFNANTAFMGPTSGGAAAPSARALVHADIPTYPVATLTSNTTLTAAHKFVLLDFSGGAFTVTVPAAASHAGRHYIFKVKAAGGSPVTFARSGSDTFDVNGASSFDIADAGAVVELVSDGVATWYLTNLGIYSV